MDVRKTGDLLNELSVYSVTVNEVVDSRNFLSHDQSKPIQIPHHRSIVELRPSKSKSGLFRKAKTIWQLFVHGSQVESYNADAWQTKRASGMATHGFGQRKVLPNITTNIIIHVGLDINHSVFCL